MSDIGHEAICPPCREETENKTLTKIHELSALLLKAEDLVGEISQETTAVDDVRVDIETAVADVQDIIDNYRS